MMAMRDLESASQKREIFGVLLRAPLFLGKWCGVATYFLYQKKKYNFTWLNCSIHIDWMKKFMFGKLKITWLWVLVTNYQRYMAFCHSYSLPKTKIMTRHRSTYPKTLNSMARLQNRKVLGIHSAQTESGLLDSCDQCTLFMHDMNDMLYLWAKLNHTNSFMNASSFLLKKIQIFFYD